MRRKLKTHKGTVKRVWRTGSGKLRRRRAMRSHHRGRQNVKQSFRRAGDDYVSRENPRIAELIPYK